MFIGARPSKVTYTLSMTPDFLKKRNALWAALRQLEPEDPKAERLIEELMTLIAWSREKIYAGLGWSLEPPK